MFCEVTSKLSILDKCQNNCSTSFKPLPNACHDTIYFMIHLLFHIQRLKKEMVMRVNQVAAEFRKVSNKQMAETTKRTIRENVAINAQLTKMSDKTLEMIAVCT